MIPIPAKSPGSYRLIHTADWHLGKSLAGLSREAEHAAFLSFLLQTIQQTETDALIIAGDVFDAANPPQSSQAQYFTFLSELFRKTECSVVIVGGNHDSPAQLEAPQAVLTPLRIHVVGAATATAEESLIPLPDRENPRLIVAAIPFLRDRDVRAGNPGQTVKEIQAEIVAGIASRYAASARAAGAVFPGIPLAGTGHLTVAGSWVSDSERDIHIGGLGAVDVDIFPAEFGYIALGHLHRPQSAQQTERVAYSGSPIPLSFSEAADVKVIRMVDFQDGVLTTNLSAPLPVARHLIQLRCHRNELQERLKTFHPPVGDLPTWVEVIVTDPVAGEPLYELVQEAVRDMPWKVIRVVQQRSSEVLGMKRTDDGPVSEVNVLESPDQVFEIRLQQESGLQSQEIEALRQTFRELLNLYHEVAAEQSG